PKKPEEFTRLLGENLISIIKEKDRIRKEEERNTNENSQRREMGGRGGGMMMDMTPEMRQQFQNMQGDTAAMRRFRETRGNVPQGQGQQRPANQQGREGFSRQPQRNQ
ncbi:MAG: hypothetical protein GX876_02415, partial [Bacteroidales bacterium]|nr:hypothetical protein [Bacteroidales bacterium]